MKTPVTLQRSMDTLHVSLDIHMCKDKMIILITLFCMDLIGPNPKLCHSKPYFYFPIASVLNKVAFEGIVGDD